MTSILRDASTETFTVPANSMESYDFTGTFVQCYEADAPLEISLNNGSRALFRTGIKRAPINGQEFESFQLWNDNDFDVTVLVGFGYGDIADTSFQASGVLKVETREDDQLATDDVNTQAKLDEILALLTDETTKRPAAMYFGGGLTYASGNGSFDELVTAAQNVNGIFIKRCDLISNGAGSDVNLLNIGGSRNIAATRGVSGRNDHKVIENCLIEAGRPLFAGGNYSSAWYYISYEVL